MFVNSGKIALSSTLASSGIYLAVGSSSVAASSVQTALGAEISGSGLTRILATPSILTSVITGDMVKFSASFISGTNVTIGETGLFNSVNSMLSRSVTSMTAMLANDNLSVSINLINT